jgi:site-specific recombinase XerD
MIYLAFISVRFNVHVHVYFDNEERPFFLDAEMRRPVEPNAFLVYVSVVKGKTRCYAYLFADWLAFCEKIKVEWRHATKLTIATYRNILLTEVSLHTRRRLKRNSINHRLGVVGQFYKFARRKGWVQTLPFDMEGASIAFETHSSPSGATRSVSIATPGTHLRLKQIREELILPPRRDVRHFVSSFRTWRDCLMAEIMWVAGLRRAVVCALSQDDLPSNPGVIRKDTVAITIVGKGQKRRVVLFPTRWLRSVDRYIRIEHRCRGAE